MSRGIGTSIPPSTASTAPPLAVPKSQPEDRVFTDASPRDLTAFLKELHGFQAATLIEPYLGKWMRVSGPLGNVSDMKPGANALVTFTYQPDEGSVWDHGQVYMWFKDAEAVGRLVVMKQGHEITVIGRLEEVRPDHIELRDCELVG